MNTIKDSQQLISLLDLNPHPEGGYYKETYRAMHLVYDKLNQQRNICTSIYYLLEKHDKSLFHKIQSDEHWFFHAGSTLELIMLIDGKSERVLLGTNLQKGEHLHTVVPANTWFAARVKDEKGYVLVSCVVSPGFDFADFQLADKQQLLSEYPNCFEIINKFSV